MKKFKNSIEEEREALSNAIKQAKAEATRKIKEYEAKHGKK